MNLIRRTGGLVVIALSVACKSDRILLPPDGLKYSVAQTQCGPADGPAVAILLSGNPMDGPSPRAPYVRVYIAEASDQLGGRARFVAGPNAEAGAWFNSTDTNYELATGGIVVASYSSADNAIVGSVDLTFANAGHFVGGFHAPLFPMNGLCA
jgi:hypothetical protein